MENLIKELRQFALGLEDEEKCVQLDDIADDLENVYYDLKDEAILDLDKFKRQLEGQNLLSVELEEFIENYMRLDN